MITQSPTSDALTFEEYVAARGRWLERVAFLLAGDPHLAQDLAQQALLQAFSNWPKVAEADQPDAYVRRILINQLRNLQRRKSWNEVITTDPPSPDDTRAPAEQVMDRMQLQTLLQELSPRARAVVVLRYYEDLDVSEVAAILNITPSAVRATASRALARLKTLLVQEDTL